MTTKTGTRAVENGVEPPYSICGGLTGAALDHEDGTQAVEKGVEPPYSIYG